MKQELLSWGLRWPIMLPIGFYRKRVIEVIYGAVFAS